MDQFHLAYGLHAFTVTWLSAVSAEYFNVRFHWSCLQSATVLIVCDVLSESAGTTYLYCIVVTFHRSCNTSSGRFLHVHVGTAGKTGQGDKKRRQDWSRIVSFGSPVVVV